MSGRRGALFTPRFREHCFGGLGLVSLGDNSPMAINALMRRVAAGGESLISRAIAACDMPDV